MQERQEYVRQSLMITNLPMLYHEWRMYMMFPKSVIDLPNLGAISGYRNSSVSSRRSAHIVGSTFLWHQPSNTTQGTGWLINRIPVFVTLSYNEGRPHNRSIGCRQDKDESLRDEITWSSYGRLSEYLDYFISVFWTLNNCPAGQMTVFYLTSDWIM